MNGKVTKIVYAPGYMLGIPEENFSTFISNSEMLYEYAKNHPNTTSWVYRPHPALGESLVGAKAIKNMNEYLEYERKWEELDNARVISGGDYFHIFNTSDGMILDSISFVSSYQYIGKPLLFLEQNEKLYNPYGQKIMQVIYKVKGNDLEGIKKFIEEVLIGKKDTMIETRKKFFEEYLDYYTYNGNHLASEFIYRDIIQHLKGRKNEK